MKLHKTRLVASEARVRRVIPTLELGGLALALALNHWCLLASAQVASLAPQPIIAASNQHVCTLFEGSVKCWGHVGHGRLGYQPTQRNPTTDSKTEDSTAYFTEDFDDTSTSFVSYTTFDTPDYNSHYFFGSNAPALRKCNVSAHDSDPTHPLTSRPNICTQDPVFMPPLRFKPELGSAIGIASTHNTQAASCALFDTGKVRARWCAGVGWTACRSSWACPT